MTLIDISWPLSPATTAYKDRNVTAFESTKNFEEHGVRESLITLGSHSGTHIDAPAHFLRDGKTADQIPLAQLCGPCTVIDMTHVTQCISAADIEKLTLTSTIILFKTKNSFLSATAPFNPNFIYLDHSAAQVVADLGISTVGIDYLGIERNQKGHETHLLLLEKNIAIVEGLRLEKVEPGNYDLWCLPLAVQGLDGAPARAVLAKG